MIDTARKTTKNRKTTRKRWLGAVMLAALAVAATAAPALAATTVPIREGNNGDTIGSATVSRTLLGDGTEAVQVDLDITGSGEQFADVHVCVDDVAFTSRMTPGLCEFGYTGLSGTTFSETLNIGSGYVGQQVCLQIQSAVVSETDATLTNTAYASWQEGQPFFGSLCLDPDGSEVPVGTWGALGLAGMLAVALGVVLVKGRRSPAGPVRV
jgi:hypothetical protein